MIKYIMIMIIKDTIAIALNDTWYQLIIAHLSGNLVNGRYAFQGNWPYWLLLALSEGFQIVPLSEE